MIRKNWSPWGGDKSLRGRDRWVRISWDQALDIVASETRRITGKYGQDALWLTVKPSDNPHYHNKIGRAHVCTPVTNAQLVCRLLPEKKTKRHTRTETNKSNTQKKHIRDHS